MSDLSFIIDELGFSIPNEVQAKSSPNIKGIDLSLSEEEKEKSYNSFQAKSSSTITEELGLSISDEEKKKRYRSFQKKLNSTTMEELGFSVSDEDEENSFKSFKAESNRPVQIRSENTVAEISPLQPRLFSNQQNIATSSDRRSIFHDYWRKGKDRHRSLFCFSRNSFSRKNSNANCGNKRTCKLRRERSIEASYKYNGIYSHEDREEIYCLVTQPPVRPSTTVAETYISPQHVFQLRECFKELQERKRNHEKKIEKINMIEDNLNQQIGFLKFQVAEKKEIEENLNQQISFLKFQMSNENNK